MTETRADIRGVIQTHPGIHFNELVRTLDLAPGQVQYHLQRLRGDSAVVGEQLYGRTHYYPPEYEQWERQALALLHRETAGDIVAYLLANGPTRPAAVAEELGIARSTLEWQLDRLTDHGLVTKRRDQRNHVILSVDNRTKTIRILRNADPSLLDRFVDRFTRLVDQLLYE